MVIYTVRIYYSKHGTSDVGPTFSSSQKSKLTKDLLILLQMIEIMKRKDTNSMAKKVLNNKAGLLISNVKVVLVPLSSNMITEYVI